MSNCSLYGAYCDKASREWSSYYEIHILPRNLFQENQEDTLEKCRDFVKSHYETGNKAEAMNFPFEREYEHSDRHVHMVSLYLLGLYLRNSFCESVRDEFFRNIRGDRSWYDFEYTWFLTCLYHDTASCVEKKSIPANPSEWQKNLKYYMDALALRNSPYTVASGANSFCKKTIRFRGSDELAKSYFYYRANQGSYDHGIIGGYLLYNRLLENFEKKTAEHDWSKEPYKEDKNSGGHFLWWRKNHPDHYAYIADAIICHNMWTTSVEDTKKAAEYRGYGLNGLIINEKSERLSRERFPLQFMLCLLDTIEPVKRFSKLSAKEILENISIEMINRNQIKVGWSARIKQEPEFWLWMKNISDLKGWMQVNVSICRQESEWCYITIDIE